MGHRKSIVKKWSIVYPTLFSTFKEKHDKLFHNISYCLVKDFRNKLLSIASIDRNFHSFKGENKSNKAYEYFENVKGIIGKRGVSRSDIYYSAGMASFIPLLLGG